MELGACRNRQQGGSRKAYNNRDKSRKKIEQAVGTSPLKRRQ